MRRFSVFLIAVLLIASCGANPGESVVDSSALETANTATVESASLEVAPAVGEMSDSSDLEAAPEPTDAPEPADAP